MAQANVYQAGAFVVYLGAAGPTELTVTPSEAHPGYSDAVNLLLSGELTLSAAESLGSFLDAVNIQLFGAITLSVGEDIDNFSDAVNYFTPTLHVTESLPAWADAIGIVGLDYVLTVVEAIPALVDKVNLLFALVLTATEDVDNLQDDVATLLAGFSQLTPGEDIDNFNDNVGMILGGELKIGEAWNTNLKDNIAMQLGINVGLSETIPTPQDAVSLNLIAELTLNVGEDTNNYTDTVSTDSATRGVGATRGSINEYIRRYLNDVEN